MTEDEAKGKWCPFARVGHSESGLGSMNRDVRCPGPVVPPEALCIGSACMMWRGSETREFRARAEEAFRFDGSRLSPGSRDVEGYCGLVGDPHPLVVCGPPDSEVRVIRP